MAKKFDVENSVSSFRVSYLSTKVSSQKDEPSILVLVAESKCKVIAYPAFLALIICL